jgi:hypothetical protein
MFSIEEFIIAVFCCVDDLLQEMTQGQAIRQKGFAPALADSEVITMEVVAESQGIDADQAIWNYFRRHWLVLFPGLGSRSTFVRQAANLWQYKERLQQRLAAQMGRSSRMSIWSMVFPFPCAVSVVRRAAAVFEGERPSAIARQKSRPIMGFMVICWSVPPA